MHPTALPSSALHYARIHKNRMIRTHIYCICSISVKVHDVAVFPGIKVKRNKGEQFRKALVELGTLDRCRKIASDETHVYLPVLPELVERIG